MTRDDRRPDLKLMALNEALEGGMTFNIGFQLEQEESAILEPCEFPCSELSMPMSLDDEQQQQQQQQIIPDWMMSIFINGVD